MAQASPKLSGYPDSFAIFPLSGAVLLPGGRLPLNIFESRYRAMVEDSLAAGRMLGMIQPDPQKPVGPAGPGLYSVGCLGRISSFSETDDARYLVTLSGLIRFAMVEELPSQRGYRRVRADLQRFASDVEPVPDTIASGANRTRLLDALRGYFTQRGFDANWDAINQMGYDSLVVTLGMVCPFEPAEKQALLEAPDIQARADVLLALLRIDAYATGDDTAGRRRTMSS